MRELLDLRLWVLVAVMAVCTFVLWRELERIDTGVWAVVQYTEYEAPTAH